MISFGSFAIKVIHRSAETRHSDMVASRQITKHARTFAIRKVLQKDRLGRSTLLKSFKSDYSTSYFCLCQLHFDAPFIIIIFITDFPLNLYHYFLFHSSYFILSVFILKMIDICNIRNAATSFNSFLLELSTFAFLTIHGLCMSLVDKSCMRYAISLCWYCLLDKRSHRSIRVARIYGNWRLATGNPVAGGVLPCAPGNYRLPWLGERHLLLILFFFILYLRRSKCTTP